MRIFPAEIFPAERVFDGAVRACRGTQVSRIGGRPCFPGGSWAITYCLQPGLQGNP